ncbi:uncharacterized protein METZ01_LOCUS307087 [marine metagenome]|uniref:Uncharacterized protein n=1 Tax=marine metagenome TaxID=408172 RepID=A0A382MZ05_9ZZZZ
MIISLLLQSLLRVKAVAALVTQVNSCWNFPMLIQSLPYRKSWRQKARPQLWLGS